MKLATITIVCRHIHSKEDAILVENASGEQVWLPRSQVTFDGESLLAQLRLVVPEWLARKKGLIAAVGPEQERLL